MIGVFALFPRVWSGFVNSIRAIEPATAMMNVGIMVAVGITYYDIDLPLLQRSAAAIEPSGASYYARTRIY